MLKGGAAVGLAAGIELTGAAPSWAAPPKPFVHGVASGDPTATAVVIWTRVTPTTTATPGSGVGPAVQVVWEVSNDDTFRHVLQHGTVTTTAALDHTVKVDVRGLQPYTRYWYRFHALGQVSRTGRTQTAPDEAGRTHALRFGFFSCSNFTGGYFTAYRHLAARDDLDMVVHLGDYLYEYGNSATEVGGDPGSVRYGPASLAGKRDHEPGREAYLPQDYRIRYGQYRREDQDLQDLHARYPWILIFDDHEVCDNTYDGGGVDQQPDNGNFYARRAGAYHAYVDWQPIRLHDGSLRTPSVLVTDPTDATTYVRFWREFTYGTLANLFALETRQKRSMQDPGLAMGLFGDGDDLSDQTHHLPDPDELTNLEAFVRAAGHQWHILANQVVFARVAITSAATDVLDAGGLTAVAAPVLAALKTSGNVVLDPDAWDGYQADQKALLDAMAASEHGDAVVITGDIHSSWANDLPTDTTLYTPGDLPTNNSAGVEFVCPSITADSLGDALGGTTEGTVASTAIQASNRHVRYLDGSQHGFCVLDVTPARVRSDWFFISDRTDKNATVAQAQAWETAAGSKHLTQSTGQLGARSDQPRQIVIATPPATTVARPTTAGTGDLAFTGLDDRVPLVAGTASAIGLAALWLRTRRASED